MSERMTNILGYLTLAAILAAIWILFGEDPTRDQGARGEDTFVGLDQRINEAAKVSLTKDGSTITLSRGEQGWLVDDRSGYPADDDKVRSFLRGFALSQRREPKTSNPDRFDRIGLGTQATNVVVRDDVGGLLLSVQVGTRKGSNNGRSLTYVFQETDTRAWLVTNIEEPSAEPSDWINEQLLDIEESRIAEIQINDATLSRALGETDYMLLDVSESKALVPAYMRAVPVRTIANLSIQDVQKLNNPLVDPVSTVTFKTHDGLSLSVAVYDYQGGAWLQVTAMFDPDQRNEGVAGVLEGAPEDGAAEAAIINERTNGWLFRINDEAANTLSKTKSDFIETEAAADTPS